ncbi:hypothetical protein LCGC14_1295610 [marine sediment metagenome]|uniref:BioF2-like acetyltransferase domain-containing protein n=1 Tax=marine sediment metagenome TaxID=412755 RepID=A0A0F9KSX7_9ZZZZ
MQLRAEMLNEEDYGRYETLNRRSPHGSVFSSLTWPPYQLHRHGVCGIFKGHELVGACIVPVSGSRMVRYIEGTPWNGPIGRSGSEGECAAVADTLVEYLLARYDEVTLNLPPEWDDVRPFTWQGLRSHVRYTYRGRGTRDYERRVQVREHTLAASPGLSFGQDWWTSAVETQDSFATLLWDWKHAYWYDANRGGKWHTELADSMIRRADELGLGFDMVGCNSPQRGLFKRGFGGRLSPYYAVTTVTATGDLRAMPVGAGALAA